MWRCAHAIFSGSWSLGRDYRVGLIDRVEGRRSIAHSAILHPLLQLLILKLGWVEGVRVAHEDGGVEHASAGIGIEVVEASAIMALDGGIVHPAHVCGKPICSRSTTSAIWYGKEALQGRTRGSRRDGRAR